VGVSTEGLVNQSLMQRPEVSAMKSAAASDTSLTHRVGMVAAVWLALGLLFYGAAPLLDSLALVSPDFALPKFSHDAASLSDQLLSDRGIARLIAATLMLLLIAVVYGGLMLLGSFDTATSSDRLSSPSRVDQSTNIASATSLFGPPVSAPASSEPCAVCSAPDVVGSAQQQSVVTTTGDGSGASTVTVMAPTPLRPARVHRPAVVAGKPAARGGPGAEAGPSQGPSGGSQSTTEAVELKDSVGGAFTAAAARRAAALEDVSEEKTSEEPESSPRVLNAQAIVDSGRRYVQEQQSRTPIIFPIRILSLFTSGIKLRVYFASVTHAFMLYMRSLLLAHCNAY